MKAWTLRWRRKSPDAGGIPAPVVVVRERRRTLRAATRIRGMAHPGDGKAPVPCLVTELSAVGARLTLDGGGDVPGRFGLSLGGDRTVHAGRTVWREDDRIGIEFDEPRRGVPPVVPDPAVPA